MPISVRKQRMNEIFSRQLELEEEKKRNVVSSRTRVSRPLRQMGILEMLDYLWRNEILPRATTDDEYVAATQQAREIILLGRWECSPYKEILEAAEEEHAID